MFNNNIRWSNKTIEERNRRESVNDWYHQAINALREGQAKLYGETVNLNDPKEVIAFLYIYQKEYESFHE